MKIGQPLENSIPLHSGTAAATKNTGQGANASSVAVTNASQSDRSAGVAVTVSTLARGLEKSARGAAAEIDTKKVESVRSAIQNGTYVVNPEAIADKLLANAQEMLNRTSS